MAMGRYLHLSIHVCLTAWSSVFDGRIIRTKSGETDGEVRYCRKGPDIILPSKADFENAPLASRLVMERLNQTLPSLSLRSKFTVILCCFMTTKATHTGQNTLKAPDICSFPELNRGLICPLPIRTIPPAQYDLDYHSRIESWRGGTNQARTGLQWYNSPRCTKRPPESPWTIHGTLLDYATPSAWPWRLLGTIPDCHPFRYFECILESDLLDSGGLSVWKWWCTTSNCLLLAKTGYCWIKIWDLRQGTARDNTIIWT